MGPDRNTDSLRALTAAFFVTALLTGPASVQATDAAAEQQAAESPPPKDLRLRRVGSKLTSLYDQYIAHRATASTQAFSPRAPHLQLANNTVVIDTAADGDVDELRAALAELGAVDIVSFKHVVSARLPLAAIPKLANVKTLRFARPAPRPVTRTGSVTSQGDAALKSDDARTSYSVDGSGITVGVLSDSFDSSGLTTSYSDDVASGDLPASIEILEDDPPGSDEGRAMAQLIIDVAPGADISFHTAFFSEADFALGIEELAGCPPGSESGCSPASDPAEVIVDDVGYPTTPFFQDGILAQAVDVVAAAGVPYFSAAGNSARASWEGPFTPSGIEPPNIPFGPGDAHDFDPGPGVDIYQLVDAPSETTLAFQWDQPYFSASGSIGSSNDFDICIYAEPPGTEPLDCSDEINLDADPVEFLTLPGGGPVNVVIYKYTPDGGPDPGFMKWIAFDDSVTVIDAYSGTEASTVFGQPNAAGAIGVGAAPYFSTPEFGVDPAEKQPFSSAGGTPIFFDTAGSPVLPVLRGRPQFVAPDAGNTTFFGSDFEPDGFPNFFGTSAAAPHAAAVAALMLDASPNLTQRGVEWVQSSSAAAHDMGPPGPDFDTGFGFMNAETAVGAVHDSGLCDGPPTLALVGTPNDGPATFSATFEIVYVDGEFNGVDALALKHVFQNGFKSGDPSSPSETSSWSNSCP